MTWRRFVRWLTQLARTPFMGRGMARRRRRQHRSQGRIVVRQLEPIASPTSLTALPGSADPAMLAPGWDNPERGATANMSVAGSTALATDTGSDGATVACGIPFAGPTASAGALDVAAGMGVENSSALPLDDNDFASLNFATSPGMPPSGAEPELGAASGILAGVIVSGVSGLGNVGLAGAEGTSTPLTPRAGPTSSHVPFGQMPSNLSVPSATTTSHAAHTATITSAAAQPASATAASTLSGGGSSPATGSPATSQATPFLGAGPFITGSSGASIMPVVYDSTASDPAQEVVQVTGQAQGQNPMSQGFSQGGVRYADGTVQLIQPDLSSSGFASAWGQTRTWTNNTLYIGGTTSTNPAGNSWVVSQLPYLLKVNSGNTIDAIVSGSNAFIFDQNNGVWVARYFLQNTLVDNNTTHQFTLTDDTGRTITLMDFSSSVPASQQGTFVSLTDSYGNQVSVVSRNSSGQITEVQSTSTQGSTTVVESYLYTYISSGTNAGLLQNVTLRRKINSGSWSTVRQVAYTYYDGTTSFGNAGDLQTATIEDASANTLATYYYRYYTSTGSGGYVHGLEYSFDPRSYARLAAAVSNPLTATNAQVAPYAQYAFQYDSSQRVTQEVVQGAGSSLASSNSGLGTFSFTFTVSGNTPGYNVYSTKTVETLPDSSTNTVFTNGYGEVLLVDHCDPTSGQHWYTYNSYDSKGRISETAEPSAVASYSINNGTLVVTLNTSSGLIHTDTYFSSTTAGETTAGGVAGDLQQTAVQQGSGGTAIEQESWQYFLHTGGGNSVAPVATDTVYRNTDGTGGETTSYSYTWYSGTTQMQSEQVSLPVISSAQNGPGSADVQTTYFDTLGRTQWTKDGDGFIDYFAYDPATSAVTTQIIDVNTSDSSEFTNLPSGWTTPSNGGLNLITTNQVDALGRDTQITNPASNVTYIVWDDPRP